MQGVGRLELSDTLAGLHSRSLVTLAMPGRGMLSRPGGRTQVAEVTASAEKALTRALTGPAIALLESCPDDLWPRLARLLAAALRSALQVARPAEAHACASVLASETWCLPVCSLCACARACNSDGWRVWDRCWVSLGLLPCGLAVAG